MIKLARTRALASFPPDFVSAKLIQKHEDLIERFYTARKASAAIAFSSAKWKTAKDRLKLDSLDKCAYCEAPTAVVAHGDVEHFRPKKLYWWLAYAFDNYVFACQICNQIYKSDNFPLLHGKRLSSPRMPKIRPTGAKRQKLATSLVLDASGTSDEKVVALWSSEKAALLHPYLQDPEPFIRYSCDDANEEVWLLASSKRGAKRFVEACDEYLGLNREELRRLRFQHYKTFKILGDCYRSPELDDAMKLKLETEFGRFVAESFPFTGMHRFYAREWGIAP
jgi:hypothetical protein